jgi:mxaL protein
LPCGAKAGLGIFTEYRSYLLLAPVETCANFSELTNLLDNINGQMAWVGGSEIAKGINFGFKIVKKLPDKPGLIFISDGQEAPPIHPDYRPAMDVKPGDVRGMLIGAGGLIPQAIPKYDPAGNLLGFWGADDVMQNDRYSDDKSTIVDGKVQAAAERDEKKSKGTEQTGVGYHRLESADNFFKTMESPSLSTTNRSATDVAHIFASGALLAFTFLYVAPLLTRIMQAWRGFWSNRKAAAASREKNPRAEIKYRI